MIVSGGNVDVASADAIQDISGYDGASSNYNISDTAAAIISGRDDVLDVNGVDIVTVTDGPVSASDGATSNFNAEVEFDVRDDASDLITVMKSGAASHLTEANSITVDADGTVLLCS